MQQAFRRTATQISKLVDDMANTMAKQEEERVEIETYQESIFQVTSMHHQMPLQRKCLKSPVLQNTLARPLLAMLEEQRKVDWNSL